MLKKSIDKYELHETSRLFRGCVTCVTQCNVKLVCSGSFGISSCHVPLHISWEVFSGQCEQASQHTGLLLVARIAAVCGKGCVGLVTSRITALMVWGLEAGCCGGYCALVCALVDKSHLDGEEGMNYTVDSVPLRRQNITSGCGRRRRME